MGCDSSLANNAPVPKSVIHIIDSNFTKPDFDHTKE